MNKKAIKEFAVWARRRLISDITYRAGMIGITEKAITQPLSSSADNVQFFDIGTGTPTEIRGVEIRQREALVKKIEEKEKTSDYKTAFQYVIEETAYTWFNRLIAIRFMEVNDYLPSGVRVLSSEIEGKSEPDMVTNPFDTDMDFTEAERSAVVQLKTENQLDRLFRMLFIKQCNKLNEILPELFEKTEDYTELLLNISFTDAEGVVAKLVSDIEEDDFREAVEIIGWMYQYYNEERKNEVINIYKGTVKKDDIPAATQLFTTDWVVKYMVDNSLGRYWIERNPSSNLQEKMDFFATQKNGEIAFVDESISPEELTFFDPCMGSGHILVYAFELLMEIYKEAGYTERDAAQSIVEKNLFGLDIDKRSFQLAYFAVMMKARSYDRRFLTRGITPKLAVIVETNSIDKFACDGVTVDSVQNETGEYLVNVYQDAKEIGSIATIEKREYAGFRAYLESCQANGQITWESSYWLSNVLPVMEEVCKQAEIMSGKYTVVCTNPPYLGKLEGRLKKFVLGNYKDYSGDLFSVFMYRNFAYCKENGYSGFMTPFVWMFIKTYEKLRQYIIEQKSITTLVQMEYSAFEEATVPICSFVLKNGKETGKGVYFRLSDFKGGMEVQKQKVLEALANKECGYFYEQNADNFVKIPGAPVAYWVSEGLLDSYNRGRPLSPVANPCVGLQTGDNGRFVRLWYEVDSKKTMLNARSREEARINKKKWFPYNKGGDFRKWYGNNEFIVNWEDDGYEIRNFKGENGKVASRPQNMNYYFRESATWSKISSGSAAFRYKPFGHVFDVAGTSLFTEDTKLLKYVLAFCNSNVAMGILNAISPTINYEVGHISNLPIVIDISAQNKVTDKVAELIEDSKKDWDSYETSWDFKKHPLI